jgi:Ion channel
VSVATNRDSAKIERLRDVALTAILVVQCFTLFVAAPFSALGHPLARSVAELLLVTYVLLIILASRDQITAGIAAAAGGCGLATGILRLLTPSAATILLAHAATIIGVLVLGYIVARAIFARGPVNTYRVLGAVVLYLNLALFFSTAYRLVCDVVPDAFDGLPGGEEGPRGFAAIIYFSFVTLTSTGYGDILPVHPFLRSLTNLESVIGQLFPATLLARLVAQHLEAGRGS